MRTFEGMHVSEGHKLKHGCFIEVQGLEVRVRIREKFRR